MGKKTQATERIWSLGRGYKIFASSVTNLALVALTRYCSGKYRGVILADYKVRKLAALNGPDIISSGNTNAVNAFPHGH